MDNNLSKDKENGIKNIFDRSKLAEIGGVTLSVAYEWVMSLESLSAYIEEIPSMLGNIEKNRSKLKTLLGNCGELILHVFSSISQMLELLKKKNNETAKIKFCFISETAASVSHLWREPLSLVQINIQNMYDEISAGIEDDENMKLSIQACRQQLDNMIRAVEMFLSFVREDSNTEIDIMQFLDEIHSFLSEYYEKDGIGFVFYSNLSDIKIYGSPNLLKQVLLLIFMHSRSLVEKSENGVGIITLKAFKENSQCVICIENNTGDFDLESPNLLESENKSSTLYMANKLIQERFNGKISSEASIKGTLFKISIP